MDRLDFSDHFSYINLFNLSYTLFSMIFRSIGYFSEINKSYMKNDQKNPIYPSVRVSCMLEQFNLAV